MWVALGRVARGVPLGSANVPVGLTVLSVRCLLGLWLTSSFYFFRTHPIAF